jgi:hypothetical protein
LIDAKPLPESLRDHALQGEKREPGSAYRTKLVIDLHARSEPSPSGKNRNARRSVPLGNR